MTLNILLPHWTLKILPKDFKTIQEAGHKNQYTKLNRFLAHIQGHCQERNEEKKPSHTSISSKIPRNKLKDLKELYNEIHIKKEETKDTRS